MENEIVIMESIVSVKPTSIERDNMNKINQFVIIAVVSIFSAACYARVNLDPSPGMRTSISMANCQVIKDPVKQSECYKNESQSQPLN